MLLSTVYSTLRKNSYILVFNYSEAQNPLFSDIPAILKQVA